MPATRYRRVLSDRQTRLLLLIGFLIRIPMFGVSVLLTVHVVETLHRSWSQAGFVSAVSTLAVAVSGPWRGRLLDRLGLRRVVLPSVLVTAACWSVAPFVGYVALLVLAGIAGLFAVPTFTIVRQGIIAAVSEDDRRTALSVDSVIVELAFMIGPVVAIALGSVLPTSWVIFGAEMLTAMVAGLLWWINPAITASVDEAGEARDPERAAMTRREWQTPRFFAVCLVGFAAIVVLAGSDVCFVAAAKHFAAKDDLGLVLAVWGLGSLLGGVVYGALPKAPPLFGLLFALAVTTIPLGLASSMWVLALLSFVAGLFCAPTMTASVDALSRVVPEEVRGEAMGWHGSFLTMGGALGGPLAGWFIDAYGFGAGFAAVGVAGAGLALIGWLLIRLRRRRLAVRATRT